VQCGAAVSGCCLGRCVGDPAGKLKPALTATEGSPFVSWNFPAVKNCSFEFKTEMLRML